VASRLANALRGRLAAKPSPSPVKPLRDISQDELRIVLREWERKMKANILAKTEAIAEAQSQREIVDALKSQLAALREHVRAQDESIRRQGTLQLAMDQSRSDHAAAMERMVEEFNAVTKDTDALRARLAQSELEITALRTKVWLFNTHRGGADAARVQAESDKKTLEILVASSPGHASTSPQSPRVRLRYLDDSPPAPHAAHYYCGGRYAGCCCC